MRLLYFPFVRGISLRAASCTPLDSTTAKELHGTCNKPPCVNHGLYMVAYQKNIREVTDETGGAQQFYVVLWNTGFEIAVP